MDRYVESEEEAWRVKAAAQRQLNDAANVTVSEVLDKYEAHMRMENKPASVKGTIGKLRRFFANALLLSDLSPPRCQSLYDAYRTRLKPNGEPIAVDHHRNVLAEAKTFLNWCIEQRYLKANPIAGVQGVGKRRKGKRQLTRDESRKFLVAAMVEADQGKEMAIAAMVALLMGERAFEILDRQVRDLDDGGRLLIITDGKTSASKRTLEVPWCASAVLAQGGARQAADRSVVQVVDGAVAADQREAHLQEGGRAGDLHARTSRYALHARDRERGDGSRRRRVTRPRVGDHDVRQLHRPIGHRERAQPTDGSGAWAARRNGE